MFKLLPLSGKFWILSWSSKPKGSRLILAKSHRALYTTWLRVIDQYDKVESYKRVKLHSISEIEIVGPSKRFCQSYDQHVRAEKIDNFIFLISYKLVQYFDLNCLPAGFVRCEADRPNDPNHYGCNCNAKICLITNKEKFYDDNWSRWCKINSIESELPVEKLNPDLIQANDEESIWFYQDQYLCKIDPGSEQNNCYLDLAKFFFRKGEEYDLTEFAEALDSNYQKNVEIAKEIVRSNKELREQEEKIEYQKLINFFKETI